MEVKEDSPRESGKEKGGGRGERGEKKKRTKRRYPSLAK